MALNPLLGRIDESMFAALYERNFPPVYRRCRRLLRSPEEAADGAHQVFLKAIESLPPGLSPDRARFWLLAVARNHCIDVLRRRGNLERALVTLHARGGPDSNPESMVVERQVLGRILRELHPRERKVLWQSVVERRALADIATDLRLTYLGTAQLLHRARLRAAVVAARLAGLLVLLWRPRHTSEGQLRFLAQPVAALAVVPVALLVTAQSSSSPHPAPVAPLVAWTGLPLSTHPTISFGRDPVSGLAVVGLVGGQTSSVSAAALVPNASLLPAVQAGTLTNQVAAPLGTVPVPTVLPVPVRLPVSPHLQ